ncbi:MAG: hypothetical protein WC473_04060 [Patescibacteria group bacterium]|jgi:hypothetical protein
MTEEKPKDLVLELLQQNLAATLELREDIKKVRRYMMWRTLWSIIWITMVIAPALWAALYLPTIMKDYENYFKVLEMVIS